MVIATSTAIAISAAVTAAGIGYSAKTSSDARSDAKDQADKDAATASKLQQEATDKSNQDRLESEAATERTLRKQKSARDAKTGRSGTILTSGLGNENTQSGGSSGSSKTVLGA